MDYLQEDGLTSDDINDWCGCSLPEAVQLASDREKWRGVVGLNGPSAVLKKKRNAGGFFNS